MIADKYGETEAGWGIRDAVLDVDRRETYLSDGMILV